MIAWTPPLRMEILQESRDPNSPNEFRRKDRDSLKVQRFEVRDPIALMYPSSQSLRRANRAKVLRLVERRRHSPKKALRTRLHTSIEELLLTVSQRMLDPLIRYEPDDRNEYEEEAGDPRTHIGAQGRNQVEQRR